MKRLFVIVVIMLGLGMCVSSMTYLNANRLTFTVEQFSRIATLGKTKKAFYYLTETFQGDVMLSDFRDYLEQSAFSDYQAVHWTLRQKNETNGRLKGMLSTRDKGRVRIELRLVKENKRWKIDEIIEDGVNIRTELGQLKAYRLRDRVENN